MMKKVGPAAAFRLLAAFCLAFMTPLAAAAEDIDTIFKRVNEFIAAKNYPKALEELGWARKEIEKLNTQKMQTLLPDSVAGFSGEKTEVNSAMGIMNLERNYKKSDGDVSIKVSLTGGGASAGMTGLAGIGQLAAMMGNAPGQEAIRIDGKTSMLEKNEASKRAELTVFLESGSILKMDMDGSSDDAVLKTFAEALKLGEIDKYLKG